MLGNRDEAHSAVLPTALEQEYWSLGIVSFDSQEYEVAAMHFRRLGARSRPLYNVALCYFLMDDKESAVRLVMLMSIRLFIIDGYF